MQYQGSIKKRLILIILFVATLTSVIGYGSFVYWYMGDQHSRTIKIAKTVALVLGQDVAKLTLLNEISAAADITSKLKSFPNLDRVVLHNQDGTAVFQYSKDNKSFKVSALPPKELRGFKIIDNNLQVYMDAVYQDTNLGCIQLNIHTKSMWDVLEQNIIMLILILVFMLLISYFLAIYYAKQFTNPILILVEFLEKIEFIDLFKQRIQTEEKNEYGKLYEEVNIMLSRMETSQKDQRIAAVAFETQSGMTITDPNQNILQINKAFTTITGYSAKEALGQTPAILNSGSHDKKFYDEMYTNLKKYHHWSGEIYNRHKDGKIIPEYLTIQAVLNEEEEIIYYVASFIDLTKQKESEEKLEYLQQYDALTGLASRDLLSQNIQTHLDEKKQSSWGALISFNIRNFKIINDAHGHMVGDLLLQEITSRLHKAFMDAKLIARIEADEFALWFDSIKGSKDSASIESKLVAQYLVDLLTKTFYIEDKKIDIILYAGISLYNQDDLDATTLLKNTKIALNLAKTEDKHIAFFDEQAQLMAQKHLDIYSQLLVAIQKQQLELYYQLQYTDSGEVYGAEALIRWNHPQEGSISPDDFIPIAERTGLILPIGEFIIDSACKQLALWQNDSKTENLIIAINISAKHFNQEGIVKQIEDAIRKYTINPAGLKVELTESIFVENIDEIVKKMQFLQKLGIKISLDDFGTGYSSLQYLKNLPLDQVKIDQSFIKNMHSNRSDIAIIKSILLMSDALEFEVVAEGVETREHYELLKELGCKIFQGYYFCKPKKINDIDFTASL